jgi:hypothetical protein
MAQGKMMRVAGTVASAVSACLLKSARRRFFQKPRRNCAAVKRLNGINNLPRITFSQLQRNCDFL